MPWLAIGTAVGGGLLNALAGNEERDRVEKQRSQALSLLRENIIDADELDLMLRNVNRLFNNRLVNTLNTTALQSRGFANANVAKASVAGAMEGSRLQSINETERSVLEANRATRAGMAQVEMSMTPTGSTLGDFTSGALAAAPVGMELSKLAATRTMTPTHAPTAGALTETMQGPAGLWDNKLYDNIMPSSGISNSRKLDDQWIYGFDSPSRRR